MNKLLFIINPNSGTGKNIKAGKLVNSWSFPSNITKEIVYTEYAGHGTEICRENMGRFDAIIAIGGDGSVNDIAQSLAGSSVPLGILPTGSGNGLARFLGYSTRPKKALMQLQNAKLKTIDTLKLNDILSVNMAGVGFDAHIGQLFAMQKKRGFISYLKLIVRELRKYKTIDYLIETEGRQIQANAFLISFANSTQFGNNAHIAPLAEADDGLMDVCILKKFGFLNAFGLALKLFNKKLYRSKYYETFKTAELILLKEGEIIAHVDGEPRIFHNRIHIKVEPQSIMVLTPEKHDQ